MTTTFRVLVPLDSQDAQTLKLALGYANKIRETVGPEAQDVFLLVHTKFQLEHTNLSRSLGTSTVRALGKGSVTLSSGGRLHAKTMKTMGYVAQKSVVIVYYAELQILDFVDGLRNIVGVVAVPDHSGDADEWVARWGAVVHGQSQQTPAPLIDDPVFVRALETLSDIINMSTGLLHPRDKEIANGILRILRAKGHAEQSANIKSWAIRRGWKPDHAADLASLATKIWALKTKPNLSGLHDPAGRYARWQSGS